MGKKYMPPTENICKTMTWILYTNFNKCHNLNLVSVLFWNCMWVWHLVLHLQTVLRYLLPTRISIQIKIFISRCILDWVLVLQERTPGFHVCFQCTCPNLYYSIYIIDQVKGLIRTCEWERCKNLCTIPAK